MSFWIGVIVGAVVVGVIDGFLWWAYLNKREDEG